VISRFEQLETREKLYLAGGCAILVILLLIFAVCLPYQRALERADNSIAAKLRQIQEIEQLQIDYRALKTRLTKLESRQGQGNNLSALTLIEDIASQIGSRENLVNVRPQSAQVKGNYRVENVDVKFEKMPLSQLLRLLKGIETTQAQLQVKTLQVKQRFDDKSQLDVNMTVTSFRENS
jgi:general secretion pathway protein M